MGLFKDMKSAIGGAKELGDHHGGMPSIGGAFKDIKALADDRGEGEVLENGTPAKAIVKSFAMPSATEKFAMQIDLEVHPQAGAPYQVTYVYPTARQKAAMSIGMEIPVKYLPDDPARVAVQWDALKGSIAAAGGDMAAVMGGLQSTYSGTADAAMRQAMGTPAAAPAQDPAERLKKLAELRDAGAITDAEFEAKKAEILRQI
jgi:putative oligomerization/nucleic acid binding protein